MTISCQLVLFATGSYLNCSDEFCELEKAQLCDSQPDKTQRLQGFDDGRLELEQFSKEFPNSHPLRTLKTSVILPITVSYDSTPADINCGPALKFAQYNPLIR